MILKNDFIFFQVVKKLSINRDTIQILMTHWSHPLTHNMNNRFNSREIIKPTDSDSHH